jgi:hypothetical protein
MAHTVVAIYDNYTEAQQARNDLTRSGFSLDQINLSPNENTADARAAALRTPHQDEGIAGTIGGFFRSLFGWGEEDKHVDIYSEAVRRGSYLLTVHTDSDEQNDRATEIVNRYHPVDIDERAPQWQSQGWTKYDAAAPALTDAEIQQERARYASGSTQAGTPTQTAIPVMQEEPEVGTREAQRGGARVFQRVVETPAQGQAGLREEQVDVESHAVDEPRSDADLSAFDDSDFRRHWQGAYGASGASYEDYAPAYRYGYQMAGQERYRNHRWGDVEPEVQQAWESGNAGHPWERVKEAIRYGWEKVTH